MSVDTGLTGPDETVAHGPIAATSRIAVTGRGGWLATWGPPAAVLVASLAVWYGVSYLLLDARRRFLVPPPHDVVQVSFLDPFNLRDLLNALWLSTRVANTLFGLQSVDQEHHDLFTLHGAGRLTRLWKLQFPTALPSIFTGLRISAGLAVIGAIVADFFFKQGNPGIGILIDRYQSRLQSEQMVGAIILSSLLGIVVFWFFGFLARRVVGGWHESAGGLET